jgi:hypothetical protein
VRCATVPRRGRPSRFPLTAALSAAYAAGVQRSGSGRRCPISARDVNVGGPSVAWEGRRDPVGVRRRFS